MLIRVSMHGDTLAFKQGLMNLPGMDKNTLVQATILHDIDKVQPDLKIGDIVNTKDVFKKGYFHAFRGASLGKSLSTMKLKWMYIQDILMQRL